MAVRTKKIRQAQRLALMGGRTRGVGVGPSSGRSSFGPGQRPGTKSEESARSFDAPALSGRKSSAASRCLGS